MNELIVFEGIDNSGKTTISKKFLEAIKKETGKDWVWTKEPDFSTEEADRLNDPSLNLNEYQREELFLASRLRQQSIYANNNCVVDRYLWTGMAYASIFSPGAYPFAKEIYTNDIFIKPSLYIFVDTPVEVCDQRDPSVGYNRLTKIREAYLNAKEFIKQPIITTSSVGDIDELVSELVEEYKSFINK